MKKYLTILCILFIFILSYLYSHNELNLIQPKLESLKQHFFTTIDSSLTCPIYINDDGFKYLYTLQDQHLNFKLNILEYQNEDFCKHAFYELTGNSLDRFSLGYSYYYRDHVYIYYFEALNSEGVKEYLEALNILKMN